MEISATMIRSEPSLKVVYLTRDPRGIVHSRLHSQLMSRLSNNDPIKEARILCKQMSHDITIYQNIRINYPNNIQLLKYEDIVRSPIAQMQLVHRFTGGSILNKDVQTEFLRNFNSFNDNGTFGTQRRNGTKTANKWREGFTTNQLNMINAYCKDVIHKLSYEM